MSYQTALTVAEVIDEIHKKKYLLPSIQREFVWDTYQIERLFDSIMRNYPIGAFLFWYVDKEEVRNFQFYEFLRDYHEKKNRHNPKANVSGNEEITAILDGQQRLTSLYVGLKGSYAYKLPRKRWDNDQAFPKRKLYLDLLSPSEDPEFEFNFKFLTNQEARSNDENHYWFPVNEILNFREFHEVNDYLIQNGLFTNYGKDKAAFANKTLATLHSIIHVKPAISYFLERNGKLEKVLNIFIRINSGGTVLSYSDLLLSIATAEWKEKDAREEITEFVDEINSYGDGFSFNKDFVLKSCLVLSDISDIAFKVDNFNKSNMRKIEKNWDEISKAIRLAVNLMSSFGFNRYTLTSNNSLIPIAYYLKQLGLPDNYAKSTYNFEDKKCIKKWLLVSLLKRVFSGQPDTVLRPLRKILKDGSNNGFPYETIVDNFKGTNKSIIFSDEDIVNLLFYKYGQSFTFSAISLLYPSFDFRNKFHVDHIFPKSYFTRYKLRKRGLSEDLLSEFMDNYNFLANLQLLEDIPNMEKHNREFDEWLSQTYKTKEELDNYKKIHFIPDVDLSFENFMEIFDEREKLITERFYEVLK